MPHPGAPVLAPAVTRSNRGEPAAKAATAQRRPRAPARVLLIAAILVVTSLGLSRPAVARTAVARTAVARTAVARTAVATAASGKKLRLNAWHYALRQRGKPYLWGGTGPYGFDCSGLVYASYRSRGLNLPRTTDGMLHSKLLTRIRKSRARRGDLAFFGSGHVELYYRGNWTFGAADAGTLIGFHRMNSFWHPTMYFRVRRQPR
jgi:cell wall-associated NlpC family hydrolase